ncbi:patatin-like phospholipase family protein [Roseinatronobacter alkalisoli]|uniref:Patatin-like phospholipase family protein n=1 Tax=Roseinatronobacter alkalisoli TaxID=3028235 RepID=A0ABT5T7Y1_9RHOB|nr:patatin-like phospholipase family protein [Roseinatronobacter sp. HJB301]MDD7971227.1 patatin-like phospholipase family protein [Roseinatronobacter sp. HJB301]
MVKRINLALQGGGAHGAFTWGVLDRLLQDDSIEIAAISGTSAGALNAAALKAGMTEGGRAGARALLDQIWHQVGAVHDLRLTGWIAQALPPVGVINSWMESVMPVSPMDIAALVTSPYQYGPLYRNPLEPVVRSLRFDNVCSREGPELYIAATNVRSGKIRVFSGDELSCDVILASACLPTLFQAVEFTDPKSGKEEAFWDGGYTGNPALFPLFEAHLPDDIMIVNINPLTRDTLPRTAQEIQNRLNEISFNSSLLREMRAIGFVKRLIAEGRMERGKMKDVLLHMIADDELMNTLSVTSKVTPTPYLLHSLKEAGRVACDRFLDQHMADLNTRTTIDLEAMFS